MNGEFTDTLTLIERIKERLAALKVGNRPAFEAVETFGENDIARALEKTATFDDRACFVIPADSHFETTVSGTNVTIRRTKDIILLITDREYGDGKAAALGGADAIGAERLALAALNDLAGQTLGLPGVILKPTSELPVEISKREADNDLNARAVRVLEFNTTAGSVTRSVARSRFGNRKDKNYGT